MQLAAWRIVLGSGPARLAPGAIELEKMLEDWIADDPKLIDPSLLVIHRQLHVEGGILDLLCVDLQGRATVVEIKRGTVSRVKMAEGVNMRRAMVTEHQPKTLVGKVAVEEATGFLVRVVLPHHGSYMPRVYRHSLIDLLRQIHDSRRRVSLVLWSTHWESPRVWM